MIIGSGQKSILGEIMRSPEAEFIHRYKISVKGVTVLRNATRDVAAEALRDGRKARIPVTVAHYAVRDEIPPLPRQRRR